MRAGELRCPRCGAPLADVDADYELGGQHLESMAVWCACAAGHPLEVRWSKPGRNQAGTVQVLERDGSP